MKVVEDLFKKAYGEKLIYWKYITENKEEHSLEICIFQVSCPWS